MAIKVLVNAVGQHIIADTRQVERKDTGDVVAYWVKNPRLVSYNRDEDGSISVSFMSYCLVSDENEFSIKEGNIVTILEPRDDVAQSYKDKVFANEPSVTDSEDGADSNLPDGATGVRTESASGEADAGGGENEAVVAEVA